MSLVRFRPEAPQNADLAHLVERRLAKAKVAGSSPVIRSIKNKAPQKWCFAFYYTSYRAITRTNQRFAKGELFVPNRNKQKNGLSAGLRKTVNPTYGYDHRSGFCVVRRFRKGSLV